MNRRCLLVGAALAVPGVCFGVACSSSPSVTGGPEPVPDGGDTCFTHCVVADGSMTTGDAEAATTPDGASPPVDGNVGAPDATTGVDAPAPVDAPIGAPDAPLVDGAVATVGAICKSGNFWKNDAVIASIPSSGFDRFGSISGDELTVAWATNAGTIYVADRNASGDAFGSASVVSTGATSPAAGERVALATNGLDLIFVSADRTSFVQLERPSIGGAWAATSGDQLAGLNGMVASADQGQLYEPVLGADGTSLYFMLGVQGGAPELLESRFSAANDLWQSAIGFPNAELQTSDPSALVRATGMSADGRTLFFYDGNLGLERGAWRASPTSPFTFFEDLPQPTEASPNHACSAVYYRGTDLASGVANLYEGM